MDRRSLAPGPGVCCRRTKKESFMIFALILAVLWILLPFVVCAVQSSTLSCRRELRALNSKLDQILHTIEVQSKAAQDVSHLDGTHSTTANGQVP